MPSSHPRTLLLLLPLLFAITTSDAHPLFWTILSGTNCTALPSSAMGPHAKPITDTQTKLLVLKKGQAVAKICPGVAHTVVATFPDKREWIVTASTGAFAGISGACPNRATSATNQPVRTANVTLTLPCSTTGTVQLTMLSVSATGDKTYQAVAAALPVTAASTCPASSCNAAPPATAPTATTTTGAIDLGNLLPTLLNGATSNGTFTLDPASVITVLKNLGDLMKNNTALQPANIVNFVQSVGRMVQGGGSSSSTAAAAAATPTDVPSAVLALLNALGAAIPPDTPAGSPPNLTSLMNFVKAVGNLLNLLSKKQQA